MTHLTGRLWAFASLASGSLLLLVLTLVWKDWIELVFRFDPDQGSGAAEWLIVTLSGTAAVIFGYYARIEWRRAATVTG
jgi:hypothetical protein